MTKQELAEKRISDMWVAAFSRHLSGGEIWQKAFTAHILQLDAGIEAGAGLSKYRLVDPFEAECGKLYKEWGSTSQTVEMLVEKALRRGAEMAKELGL